MSSVRFPGLPPLVLDHEPTQQNDQDLPVIFQELRGSSSSAASDTALQHTTTLSGAVEHLFSTLPFEPLPAYPILSPALQSSASGGAHASKPDTISSGAMTALRVASDALTRPIVNREVTLKSPPEGRNKAALPAASIAQPSGTSVGHRVQALSHRIPLPVTTSSTIRGPRDPYKTWDCKKRQELIDLAKKTEYFINGKLRVGLIAQRLQEQPSAVQQRIYYLQRSRDLPKQRTSLRPATPHR